jgi:hypothetical protein
VVCDNAVLGRVGLRVGEVGLVLGGSGAVSGGALYSDLIPGGAAAAAVLGRGILSRNALRSVCCLRKQSGQYFSYRLQRGLPPQWLSGFSATWLTEEVAVPASSSSVCFRAHSGQ